MNPPHEGHPERDGPPDRFDDLHSEDPRNHANDPRPEPNPDDPGPDPEDPYSAASDEVSPKLEWTLAASLAGKPVPSREWIIDEWLPVGNVTSLIGAGGVGKSLLAQHLATAVSLGASFFGLRTTQCRVLGVFCEDDNDELHRRQAAICDQSIDMASITEFAWTARAGEQNSLVHESPLIKGRLDWSGLFMTIEETAKTRGARLIIFDNIAQLYGANENDRALVTSFVNRLHKLAHEINGSVLLLGHPGKGVASKEFSGSTAWDAAVRSRWLLRRPESDENEEGGAGDFIRELCKMKANYSSIGDVIPLEWDRGCFHALGATAPGFKSMHQKCEESARETQVNGLILQALDKLRQQGRHVTLASNQPTYAVKILPTLEPFKKANVRRKDVQAGLQSLFDAGRIRNGVAICRKSNRHMAYGIGRVEWNDQPTPMADPDAAEKQGKKPK